MTCPSCIARSLIIAVAVVGAGLGISTLTDVRAQDEPAAQQSDAPATPAALNFEMKSLEGEDVDLSQYHGQVVLIVNTASKCGLTKQYEGLQGLHKEYAEKGLAVLGFPANNFGQQEPGTDEQIEEFCEQNYGVEFDMFSKVSVKGEDICPLYAFLTGEETNPGFDGPIRWNFEKFLISREGKVVARFAPRTAPDAEEVIAAIQAELAKPVPAGVGGGDEAGGEGE